MQDPQKKQKLFYSRAQHQIKEIQYNCKELIALSQQLDLIQHNIGQSQLSSRKIQFLKTQTKEKLQSFASNIDEIYKILDRKLTILSKQIANQLKNKTNISTSSSQYTTNSLNKSCIRQNQKQRSGERTKPHQSYDQERLFSDTLNPRITQLQTKIAQYQRKEAVLHSQVYELQSKNQKLLEEFNKLSSASNKKINQLSFQLSNRLEKQKDSFGSIDSKDIFKQKVKQRNVHPALSFNSVQELANSGCYEKNRPDFHPKDEDLFQFQSDEKKGIKKQEQLKQLAFGCLPTKNKAQNIQHLTVAPAKLTDNDIVGNLGKNDKSRRFDLLLNRLRDSQASNQNRPHQNSLNQTPSQQFHSVFSQQVVKRYKI